MPFDGREFNAEVFTIDSMINTLSDPQSWTKDRRKDPGGWGYRYCLLGILEEVMRRNYTPCPSGPIKRAMAKAIIAETSPKTYRVAKFFAMIFPSMLIMNYNDDRSTTHADVMSILSTARKQLA